MSAETKKQNNTMTSVPGIKINYTVKSFYKELFGEEMTTFPTTIDDNLYMASCGMTYIPELESYATIGWGCGGGSDTWPYIYHYKYTEQDNKAFSYVAIAKFNIDTEKWTELGSDTVIEGVSGGDITEENYAKFPKYKLTFEKDSDGNYVYKTLEKVND